MVWLVPAGAAGEALMGRVSSEPSGGDKGIAAEPVLTLRRPIVVTVKAGTALAATVAVAVTALGVVGLRAAWVADHADHADHAGDVGASAEGVVLPRAPDGTVPSVFAHTRASATGLLEDLGLSVRFGEQVGCELAGHPGGHRTGHRDARRRG